MVSDQGDGRTKITFFINEIYVSLSCVVERASVDYPFGYAEMYVGPRR
jgi:hypothetical protein